MASICNVHCSSTLMPFKMASCLKVSFSVARIENDPLRLNRIENVIVIHLLIVRIQIECHRVYVLQKRQAGLYFNITDCTLSPADSQYRMAGICQHTNGSVGKTGWV